MPRAIYPSPKGSPGAGLSLGRLISRSDEGPLREGLRAQAQFNNASRERPYHRSSAFCGRAPVFRVPKAAGELLGDSAGSPFLGEGGDYRVWVHHQERRRLPQIIAALGPPAGFSLGVSTSSQRTFYPLGLGCVLKSSFPASSETTSLDLKVLLPQDAAVTIEREAYLARRGARFVQRERSALLVPEAGLTELARELPSRPDGAPRPGDFVAPWHVFASRAFAQSERGQRLFAAHGGFERWVTSQVEPALLSILVSSFFECFTHFELHAQNLELVVDAGGEVLAVKVKDFLDARLDPAAELALTGRCPDWATAERLRRRGTGHIGGSIPEGPLGDEPPALLQYYIAYFNRLRQPLTEADHPGEGELCRDLVAGVLAECRRWLAVQGFTPEDFRNARDFPEACSVFGDPWRNTLPNVGTYRDFFVLDDVRNLLIKAGLTRRFIPDEAAEPAFRRAAMSLSTSRGAASVGAPISPGSVGFVGDVPVSVRLDDAGRVTDFNIALGPDTRG